MRRLFLAVGNPLRGDDGAAGRVLALLAPEQGTCLRLHQLTPEVAAELEGIDEVFFMDADPGADSPRIERIGPGRPWLGDSHTGTPASIVHLARRLFGFRGDAYLCRIPARDFSFGEQLSAAAESQAQAAAALLRDFTATMAKK
jgi:hydrogenase maturation protease